MTVLNAPTASAGRPDIFVNQIGSDDLRWALREGWSDFQAKRGDLLLVALIYPLVAFAAAAFSFNAQLLAMFFPLVAGLSILGPAVATGQ